MSRKVEIDRRDSDRDRDRRNRDRDRDGDRIKERERDRDTNPRRPIRETREPEQEEGVSQVEVFPTFDAMGLKEDLLRGIYSYGIFTFNYYDLFYSVMRFVSS
jgi:hypothetical protein